MLTHRYTKDSLQEVELVVNKWRHRELLTGREGGVLFTFVNSVSRDRWNGHFKNKRRDWVDTQDIRDNVPLAFMDYLLYPSSIRTPIINEVTRRQVHVCPISPSRMEYKYPSLASTMYEFRMQFPRLVSVLQATHVGVTLLQQWQPRNYKYMANLPDYIDLHAAMLTLRRLSNTYKVPLYDDHRYALLDTVANSINHFRTPLMHVNHVIRNPRNYSRVTVRRATVAVAACDVLATRIIGHTDALKQEQLTTNTYYDDYTYTQQDGSNQ
jgi:hypothetical protein